MRMVLERGFLLLLTILSLIPPIFIGFSSASYSDNPSRGIVIAPAYVAMCILGITAAFYPRDCSRPLKSLRHREDIAEERRGLPRTMRMLSHHPPCDGLRAHEFELVGRRFCVGCTGMTVGAVASSILVVAYFSQEWILPVTAHSVLLLGVLFVALELTQTLLLDMQQRVSRFLINALFVVGVSLILVGEDMLKGSLLLDSYVLFLALLWLYIRIRSSQLSHHRICAKCSLVCPFETIPSGGP